MSFDGYENCWRDFCLTPERKKNIGMFQTFLRNSPVNISFTLPRMLHADDEAHASHRPLGATRNVNEEGEFLEVYLDCVIEEDGPGQDNSDHVNVSSPGHVPSTTVEWWY